MIQQTITVLFVCSLTRKSMDLTINKVTEKIKMLQETSEKLQAPLKAEYILIMQTVLVTVNRGGWLFWHFIEYNIKR